MRHRIRDVAEQSNRLHAPDGAFSPEHRNASKQMDNRVQIDGPFEKSYNPWDRAGDRLPALVDSTESPTKRPIRAGMVTTWNSKCGIAEYSRYLLDAFPDDNIAWSILAPKDEAILAPDAPYVSRCWQKRSIAGLSGVLEEVVRQILDVVHLQFRFGLFPLEELASLVSELKSRKHCVFITFHSTEYVKSYERKVSVRQVTSRLQEADRLFVHTDEDERRMASWGLQQNVSRFPHGFSTFADQDREQIRRELGLSRSPVIATFGFLRPHKGIVELIESLDILRRRYPDVLLLAVTAMYPDQESQSYYGWCLQRVAALDLARHCKMVTDFLTRDEIMILLQAADVAVLAYHPINDSVSGAVRFPLASHRPVVTTQHRVFSDISNEVFQIKRATPRAIARGVTRILTDGDLSREICERAERRVSIDSWENVATDYSKILKTHVADSR